MRESHSRPKPVQTAPVTISGWGPVRVMTRLATWAEMTMKMVTGTKANPAFKGL